MAHDSMLDAHNHIYCQEQSDCGESFGTRIFGSGRMDEAAGSGRDRWAEGALRPQSGAMGDVH